MSSQDVLRNASTLASYNVLLQVHEDKQFKRVVNLRFSLVWLILVLPLGDVPCAHLSAQRIHTAVRVQRADRGGQCQVKMAHILGQKTSASPFHCMTTDCFVVCVFVTQAHSAVLNVSVSIQRSFPESLSQWGIWDKPQLETGHQPAVADVS